VTPLNRHIEITALNNEFIKKSVAREVEKGMYKMCGMIILLTEIIH